MARKCSEREFVRVHSPAPDWFSLLFWQCFLVIQVWFLLCVFVRCGFPGETSDGG